MPLWTLTWVTTFLTAGLRALLPPLLQDVVVVCCQSLLSGYVWTPKPAHAAISVVGHCCFTTSSQHTPILAKDDDMSCAYAFAQTIKLTCSCACT